MAQAPTPKVAAMPAPDANAIVACWLPSASPSQSTTAQLTPTPAASAMPNQCTRLKIDSPAESIHRHESATYDASMSGPSSAANQPNLRVTPHKSTPEIRTVASEIAPIRPTKCAAASAYPWLR